MSPPELLAHRRPALAHPAHGTYPSPLAKVVDKRPNGAVLIEVPAEDAADPEVGASVEVRRTKTAGEWPAPFGALAGVLPALEIDDIKAARRDALQAKTR